MATADFSPSLSATTVSEGVTLQSRLDLLARRRNAQRMVRALMRAAIPGIGVAGLAVLLYKLHIIPDGPMWAPAAIIAVFLLWGFRTGRLQRVNSFEAACDADQALDLNDRLSSALAFVAPAKIQRQVKVAAPSGFVGRLKAALLPQFTVRQTVTVPPTDLVAALVGEATTRAAKLDPRRVYPLTFDRPAQILTVLALLFVGLCFMPDYAIFQSVEERKQVAAMQSAGEKLVVVAKTIQKKQDPKAEDVKRLARRLEKLGQKMVRGRMTKRAALTEMGELRQKLQQAQKQNSQSSKSAGMLQIAEALREAPLQSETGRKVQEQIAQNKWDEAAKSLEQLADQVEKNQLSEGEKQKTASDLQKVAKDLRSRGGQANQQTADQLDKAAQQLQQKGQSGQDQQQQNGQQQSQQQSQNGGQKQPQQSGQQQNGQGQQPNKQQGQQSPQPGIQSPLGQRPGQSSSKQGQQQQNGQQQGQQQQGGQQQGGQQQGSQSGGQQQQQGGQQGQSSQSGSSPQGGQSGNGSASDALRNMANGLRQGGSGGGNSQNLQDMMNKLREAENQTGTNGGQQFGMGKPGQAGESGSPFGQGKPQFVTPGKDLLPSDPHGQVNGGAGLGPRNNAQGVQNGGGVSKQKSQRTGDKRRYGDVWSDRLPKTHKQIDRIQGKWGGNGEVEQLPTRGEAKGGQVKTPYYDVYESYKRDEEQAVSRDSVPPAYKQPVKDYFESIKP